MIQRHLESLILDSLKSFPVVLLTGARQVGKSTLVEALCRKKWKASYLTLDDRNLLDMALTDPDGLIASHEGPLAIDEVQKAPDLLRAIKLSVDRNRKPGRFLLTGSANILTLKSVSETLAGRIVLHELYPFSFSEFSKRRNPGVLKAAFHSEKTQGLTDLFKKSKISREDFLSRILGGGYPEPSLAKKVSHRDRWFKSYRKTYVERDIREISAIERVPDFNRLMTMAAARTGQALNLSDLGRDSGLPYMTLRRYMNILEQTYQIFLVPPFFTNVSKHLMKAPKLYWTDTGFVSHILDIHDAGHLGNNPHLGAIVETWVASELKKMISLESESMTLYGWRTPNGQEVDFLIEKGGRFLAIEVKWSRHIEKPVLHSFKMLKDSLRDHLVMGVVLYRGEDVLSLGEKLIAVPYESFFGA